MNCRLNFMYFLDGELWWGSTLLYGATAFLILLFHRLTAGRIHCWTEVLCANPFSQYNPEKIWACERLRNDTRIDTGDAGHPCSVFC